MRRLRVLALGVAGALAATTLAASPNATAVDDIDTRKLREAVTVGGILGHERVLQRIANNNGGTRASGTPGYDASAQYVKRTLRRAGYRVYEQEFIFPFFQELSPATLEQTSPTPTDYETATFTFSGSGDVTGTLVPIDITIPPPAEPSSTSGCEPEDFPAAPADPAIALIQRGSCTFEQKAANAQGAGYDAVIIFNEGQEGRTELVTGTLGRPFDLPVVGLSFADGEALYNATQAGDVEMHVVTETENDPNATTTNVFAETRSGDPQQSVVVGAHLDSVIEGPGINDNGSGTSALLEIAEQMAGLKKEPRQQVRFAFWGAEELGLLGSEHYVASLSDRRLGNIAANLNFDMLGSPNFVRFVYDGDGSDTPDAGPPGSAQIEDVFTDYFDAQGLASDPTAFDGRSDYGPFHRGRHPGRRAVLRCRGDQDPRTGRDLRRDGRRAVRPLLPPGLRHDQQPEYPVALAARGRRRARDPHARADQDRVLRGRRCSYHPVPRTEARVRRSARPTLSGIVTPVS